MSAIAPTVQAWFERARQDPDAFWAEAAGTVPWFRTWDRVFEWDYPAFRWFIGGSVDEARQEWRQLKAETDALS